MARYMWQVPHCWLQIEAKDVHRRISRVVVVDGRAVQLEFDDRTAMFISPCGDHRSCIDVHQLDHGCTPVP